MFPFEDEADAVVYDEYGAPVDDDIFKPSDEALGAAPTRTQPSRAACRAKCRMVQRFKVQMMIGKGLKMVLCMRKGRRGRGGLWPAPWDACARLAELPLRSHL